jgi:transcriptional regulator with XRE-family HTH domain
MSTAAQTVVNDRIDVVAFARRLAEARGLSGESQREVDRLAGLPTGLGRIERGIRVGIELATAAAYARTLGASLDWLVFGIGRAPSAARVRRAIASARARAALRLMLPQGNAAQDVAELPKRTPGRSVNVRQRMPAAVS